MRITWESNFDFWHYGVEGMKWGIRRYQNPDGTLTPLGRSRAGRKAVKAHDKMVDAALAGKKRKTKKYEKKFNKIDKKIPAEADKLAEEREAKRFSKQRNSRDRSTLSDEELGKRIDRLAKEKNYKGLVKQTRVNEDAERGREAAKQTAERIGVTTATAIGTSLACYFGTRFIAKKLGVNVMPFKDAVAADPEGVTREMFKFVKPKK